MNGYDRITGLEFASRSEVIATNGMAATSHPHLQHKQPFQFLRLEVTLLMLLLQQMLS